MRFVTKNWAFHAGSYPECLGTPLSYFYSSTVLTLASVFIITFFLKLRLIPASFINFYLPDLPNIFFMSFVLYGLSIVGSLAVSFIFIKTQLADILKKYCFISVFMLLAACVEYLFRASLYNPAPDNFYWCVPEWVMLVALMTTTISVERNKMIYLFLLVFAFTSPYFLFMFSDFTGLNFEFPRLLQRSNLGALYPIASFILILLFFYKLNPAVFAAIFKDSRGLRVIYYILCMFLGLCFALKGQAISGIDFYNSHIALAANFITLIFSLVFASHFAIIVNNVADVDIDKISNPSRPLTTGCVAKATYLNLGYVFLMLSLIYASIVGFYAVLTMSVCMGSYFLYSAYPLRFKRLTIISKFVVGFNSWVLFSLGFFLVQGDFNSYPSVITFIFFVVISLVSNFIDIKDIAGDRQYGINTLPVMFGSQLSKLAVSAAYIVLNVILYYLLDNVYLLPLFLLNSLLCCYCINKKHYEEWKILVLNNLGILFLSIYLCFY